MRPITLALLALGVAACAGEEPRGGPEGAAVVAAAARPSAGSSAGHGAGVAVSAAADGTREIAWEDPEPQSAQALTEAVVDAEWNRTKRTGIAMKILPLVDRTTGIAGFVSEVAGRTRSLEDRLAGLGARVTETDVTIRLPGAILFDFDSAAVRPDAEATLVEVAAVLAAYGGRPARIEGHTDSIASDAYNLDLSRRRAESIRGWLIGRGVEPARLTSVGHGESRPVADNSTAQGRQLNRRVEIVIARK